MQTETLVSSEILSGYDAVIALYPHIPPLSHWRAWEHAAYQRYSIGGRILDLGCGDGRYFRLIWPLANDVVGVDISPDVAELGQLNSVDLKVYRGRFVLPCISRVTKGCHEQTYWH